MLGGRPRPKLRQQQEWHAGGENKRLGRPVAWQSLGSRTTHDHQIGMQGVQRRIVVDVILIEKAELEADAFTRAGCGEAAFCRVDRGGFLGLVAGNDLPDGLPPLDKGLGGTTAVNRRHHKDPDQVRPMTRRHPGCIAGSRLASRRGIDKDGNALERH